MLNSGYRAFIVKEIKDGENKYRKDRSWKQYRVMSDDYEQYVAEKLAGHYDLDTVIEMPKIASINVANKIVEKTAVVYKHPPKREYTEITDQDEEILERIYKEGKFNRKLRASNRAYKYQNQNLIQVIPKRGKLVMKSLKLHQYDVIPMDNDPEEAKTIILSVNDRQNIDTEGIEVTQNPTGRRGNSEINSQSRDYENDEIADEDDYKELLERYVVWDLETGTNFLMNGKGHIFIKSTNTWVMGDLSDEQLEEVSSEFIQLTGRLPFIDVAFDKDFTYFIRKHHSVTDFTIDFNAAFSDYADTNHMQSKAQAIIKGPADLLANEVRIGSHLVLKLVKQFDEQGREIDMDFTYANPSPDMSGAREFIESFLALYLSSRDVDSSEVTMSPNSDRFNSGFERFLALFETFSASKEDFDVYKEVEEQLYEIVKGWIAVARETTELLDPKFLTSSDLSSSTVQVEFNKPEEVKSSLEQLTEIQKELELGLTSRVKALAKRKNITEEKAKEIISEIDLEDGLNAVEETGI